MDSINRYLTKDEQSIARQKYINQQIQLNKNKQIFNDYVDQQASEEKYKNIVVVNPQIENNQLLITKTTESKDRNRENEEGKLQDNLLNIADGENALSIRTNLADLLNDEQIKLINDSWVGIMHKARKLFAKGVEKQTFINFVISYIQNIEKGKQPIIKKQAEIIRQESDIIDSTDNDDINDLYEEDNKIEQSVKTERTNYQYDYFTYKIGNYIKRLIIDGRIINNKTLVVTGKGNTNLFNRNMDQTNKLQMFTKELGQKYIDTKEVQLYETSSSIPLEEGIKLLQSYLIPTKGGGLNRKKSSRVYRNNIRFMIGAGAGEVLENRKQPRYVQLNKYMVNMDELEYKNVIVLKYVRNRNIHSKYKQKQVSDEVKSILMELLLKETFNHKTYEKLTNLDKIVIYDFLNACHVDVGLLSIEEDKQKVYDTLLGEYQSGNNNPQIIAELRSIIVNAIENREIEVQKGLVMLTELK